MLMTLLFHDSSSGMLTGNFKFPSETSEMRMGLIIVIRCGYELSWGSGDVHRSYSG